MLKHIYKLKPLAPIKVCVFLTLTKSQKIYIECETLSSGDMTSGAQMIRL